MLYFEPVQRGRFAVLQMGFRPFFLLAVFGAVGLGVLWLAVYSFNMMGLRAGYAPMSWHAHEMIFGYTLAVISGFLLTAVKNWTHIQTVNGVMLIVLSLIWVTNRVLPWLDFVPLGYLLVSEAAFIGLVLFFAAGPIVRRRQWQQLGLLSLLALLLPASVVFHLGVMGIWPAGIQLGLYLGLYLVVGLILVMGRRVIPGFIENATGGGFRVRNDYWLDLCTRILFVAFLICELFALVAGHRLAGFLSALLALVLFVFHAFRLSGWHHRRLWLHPLLWSLYLAYAWITIGFLLKFLTVAIQLNPWVAVHAFAYGGIGLVTTGMMARVTLGHTGRNVFAPPPSLGIFLGLLAAGVFLRVIMTWLWPSEYQVWILAAQILWILAFLGLAGILTPMLLKARVDGAYG